MADIWYNIGQIAIGIGDLRLAYEAFKIAVNIDPKHAESINNLGVLELRQRCVYTFHSLIIHSNLDEARNCFSNAHKLNPNMHEPIYNESLMSYKLGEFQHSYELLTKVLEVYPEHSESLELMKKLKQLFISL
jgi:tetratricopeptide repeat protein 8